MFPPLLRIEVLDNAAKQKGGLGTVFGVEFNLNSVGADYITYSLLDEIHNSKAYNKYCDMYAVFIQEQKDFENYQKEMQKNLADASKQKRVEQNTLNEQASDLIDTVINNHEDLVRSFLLGKDKALNSLVGKVLSKAKSDNIQIDPLVAKITITQKLG